MIAAAALPLLPVIGTMHVPVSTRMTEGGIAPENGVGHGLDLRGEKGREVGQGIAMTKIAESAEIPAVQGNDFPLRTTTVRVRIEIAVGTGLDLGLAAALSVKENEANPDGRGAGLMIEPKPESVAGHEFVRIVTSRGSQAAPRHAPRGVSGPGHRVLVRRGRTEAAPECAPIAASAAAR